MMELTDGLKSEVSALRAEHYAPSHNNRRFAGPNFYRNERERERDRVSRAKDVGVSALLTMHLLFLLAPL